MKRLLGAAPVLILALLLAACVRHRWLEVEPGEYTQVRGTDDTSRAAARHIRGLQVDREAATATLTLDDGSQIPLAFVPRQRSRWPEGCPTNLLQHHMEVLDLEESNLSIASLTFQEPVLVRNCPVDPLEIVLREDGPIGGSGSVRSDSCLVFSLAKSSPPEAATVGQWQGAGYAFLRGPGDASLMFWYDEPSAARCQTHASSENQLYRASCSAEPATGQQVEWEVTIGGAQAGVTIDGKSYDLDGGRLFLITSGDGATKVMQLDRDLSAVEPEEEGIIAFAQTVPEILRLVRQASDPEDAAPPSLPDSGKGYDATGTPTKPGQGQQAELEAVLKMPQTLPDGERVPLTFTLINRTDRSLYVLEWYTPLEGIAGEIFLVRRDGQTLPYQGILAMRGDPGPEDYVRLAPGASATATVDLAQAYDFSQMGTYTVRFLSPHISHVARTEADMARTVDDLGPVAMPSHRVTVTVGTGE